MTWTKTGGSQTVPPVQLSDGTCILLINGSLYWTTDRSTLNLIGAAGTQSALHGATLCRDASDNLYIIGLIASSIGSGWAQAWVKGSGLSWAAQTEQSFVAGAIWTTGGTGGMTAVHGRASWTSTGGTVGAGQIVVPYQDTNGVVGALTLDAGALLSAGTPALTAATSYPTTGISLLGSAQDGYGQPTGWAVASSGGTFYVYYWTATATAVTVTSYTAAVPGGAISGAGAVTPYAPGAALFLTGNVIAELSPAGTIYGPATYTVPSGATMTLADATYVRSVGRVWVYAQSATYSLSRFGITPGSPPTIDTTAVAEQTNGAGWVNSQTPAAIVTSDYAFGQVDYLEATGPDPVYGGATLYASAPAAATLTGPLTGAYIDVAAGATLTATYRSTDGAPANAWAARIKTSGGSYQYLNAGTGTLGASVVWNPATTADGASLTISLPSGLITNGNTYNWSVAFQEGFANLQGPFATDFVFTAQAAPTLMITGPSGTVTTSQPILTWTATPASGLSVTGYEIVVESGAYTTTPGAGTLVWDSGVVPSSLGQGQVGVSLANATTYRAFVQVTETHGETSAWAHVDLPVVYDQPAAPALTVAADVDPLTGAPRMAVTIQGQDNVLSLQDASFEGGIGTWTVSNGTIAVSTDHANDGSQSGKLTATASGTVAAQTGRYPVLPSTRYSPLSAFRAATTGRVCTLSVHWYDGAGTAIRTDTMTAGTDGTSSWLPRGTTVLSPSPSTAVTAAIEVDIAGCAAGEVHYIDTVALIPGTTTVWSRGGLAGNTAATVTRVDPTQQSGVVVRAGAAVPLPSDTQEATVYDYEAPLGVVCVYTAQVVATV